MVSFPVGSRQLDLFDNTLRLNGSNLVKWKFGVAGADIRQAIELKRTACGLTQDDLAYRVGISRPQLTNGLHGRFGFGRAATAKLKEFIASSDVTP